MNVETHSVSIEVIRLNVDGVATHYPDKVWVDEDEGYYKTIEKPYKLPKVKIDFLGKVNIELEPNSVYTDGINNFIAITKDKIKNMDRDVVQFRIPNVIIRIYKPYKKV